METQREPAQTPKSAPITVPSNILAKAKTRDTGMPDIDWYGGDLPTEEEFNRMKELAEDVRPVREAIRRRKRGELTSEEIKRGKEFSQKFEAFLKASK